VDFLVYINTVVGKTEAAPLITPVHLTKGRLVGGFLFFPPGPAGVLHFQARFGLNQILPFTPGESYQLDDCVIPFSLGFDLVEPPFNIDCVTWNESTSWPHVLTVCFFLAPPSRKKFTLGKLKNALFDTNGYPKP